MYLGFSASLFCLLSVAYGRNRLLKENSACQYSKIGCSAKAISLHHLTKLIDEPYGIDWMNFETWSKRFACRCSQAARKREMGYFTIRSFKLCFGTNNGAAITSARNKYYRGRQCLNGRFSSCKQSNDVCVGASGYDFFYSAKAEQARVQQTYKPWGNWGACSNVCGKGRSLRSRACISDGCTPQKQWKGCTGNKCSTRIFCRQTIRVNNILTCDSGKKVHIYSAVIGRSSQTVCRDRWRRKGKITCSVNVTKDVSKQCQDKERCALRVTRSAYRKCRRVVPYLVVKFACL